MSGRFQEARNNELTKLRDSIITLLFRLPLKSTGFFCRLFVRFHLTKVTKMWGVFKIFESSWTRQLPGLHRLKLHLATTKSRCLMNTLEARQDKRWPETILFMKMQMTWLFCFLIKVKQYHFLWAFVNMTGCILSWTSWELEGFCISLCRFCRTYRRSLKTGI